MRGQKAGVVTEQLIELLDRETAVVPHSRDGGSLLLLVGLPGSGKSSVVAELQHYFPTVVVSTDGVRAMLRDDARYTAGEMGQVYELCYDLIERRLRAGQRVVFDASNYLAARRQHVIRLAENCGAAVAIATIQAAQETVRLRLQQRMSSQRWEGDLSDADWSVYKWMVEVQEPVTDPHIVLDSTMTPPAELAEQLAHYWLQVEERAHGNLDLQPHRWSGQPGRND
jgi:predicted kinase